MHGIGGLVTRIAVDPARPIGSLDRNVFGGFIEHLGRCIYGGLYAEDSPRADARGFRGDVLGLLRELRMGCCAGRAATSSATTTGPTASGPKIRGHGGLSLRGEARSPIVLGLMNFFSTAPNSEPSPTSA
jgi:hypothetical protein